MGMKIKGTGLLTAHGRPEVPVGTFERLNNGNLLQYVKLSTTESVLPAVGSPLAWRAAGDYNSVTTDLSRTRSQLVCGVNYASGLASTLPYGWMLVQGNPELDGVTLKTDGNVAANTKLCMVADKVFDGVEIDSDVRVHAIGLAIIADSGSQLVSARISGWFAG